MDQRFDRIVSTQRALAVLHKFETLNLPNLGIQEKYQRILGHYARDIEMVSKIYQKNKSDPPIARDLPPIAGESHANTVIFVWGPVWIIKHVYKRQHSGLAVRALD